MEDLHIMVLIVLGILAIGYAYHLYNQSCDENENMKNIKRSRSRPYPYMIGRSGCSSCNGAIESFAAYDDDGEYYDTMVGANDWLIARGNLLPWWNSTRHTRNMSWDIRGDVPIVPHYVGPWLNSPLL